MRPSIPHLHGELLETPGTGCLERLLDQFVLDANAQTAATLGADILGGVVGSATSVVIRNSSAAIDAISKEAAVMATEQLIEEAAQGPLENALEETKE